MPMAFIKIYNDWIEATAELKDAEKGRLIDALVRYARSGEIPTNLDGCERFLFPSFRLQVDRDKMTYAEISQKRAVAGSLGGKQKVANGSKSKQTVAKGSKSSKSKQDKDQDHDHDKDKDKDEDYRGDDIARTEPDAAAFLLPLADGSAFPVTETDIAEYETLYPAVDVRQEMRNMIGWCKANPTKRKTKVGISRFVNNWLCREQDKGGPAPQIPNRSPNPPKNPNSGSSNIFMDMWREEAGQ